MKRTSANKIPVLVFLSLLLCLLFTYTAFAAEYQTIVLTGESGLEGPAAARLKTVFKIKSTGIAADYPSRVFITDEGTRVPFAKLLTRKSLKSSPALKTLADEYQPDALALMWVERYSVEENKAYDLKKYAIRVRLRIVDVGTGKTIVDEPLRYESSFAQKVERSVLLRNAVQTLNIASVKSLIDAHYGKLAGTKRLKIVIRNIDQPDYFAKRDEFLTLAQEAGITAAMRDTYDRGSQTFTLRSTLETDLDAYYRALYARATDMQTFDNFDIEKSGATILITKLPPERKRLIISGLTEDRYHDRLKIYRDALTAQGGIKDMTFRYLSGSGYNESKLVFSFTYSGDITRLEEGIWNSLSSAGEAPNRRLVSISEKIIHIKSELKEGDRVAMTVHFNNVGPGDYRKIGATLDKIIKGLSVRNLTKAYDPDAYRLTYNFDVRRSPVSMDTILWSKIEADEILSNIVQDTTHGNTLAYFYHFKPPETTHIRMSIKNLSPQDYKMAGRRIISIISGIEGVAKLNKTYSEYDQTLHITFHFSGKNAYAIDEAIWNGVSKDRSLTKLSMGAVSEDELVYFFSGASKRAGDIVVIMKRVSGQNYKVVSTSFSKLLGKIKHVRDVRYSYYFDKKTIGFTIMYEGKSLFDFEDALQRRMRTSDLFAYVAKGPEQPNRLVYFYYTKPLTAELKKELDESQPSETGETSGRPSDISGLVASLDKTVVVVLSYTAAGPTRASGFFVGEDGYILTSAKTIAQGKLIVRMHDGTQLQAQKVKIDQELDLALIQLISPKKTFQSAHIGDAGRLRRGDTVFIIGGQHGQDYGHRTESGIVTGLHLPQDMIQVSMPVSKVRRGAPVFDLHGRVVAVMSGTAYPQGENRALAVPINHARSLLQVVR